MQHKARKHFGQHFLHERGIIQAIVAAINPKLRENLIEIGPGLGALTTQVLPLCQRLQVIEIDRDVIPHLEQACSNLGDLQIHQGDVLKVDFSQFPQPMKVFGNLPYNISTPLLFHLLEAPIQITDMVFMLQKEVVDRMCASPHSKQYGRLTVMVQYHCAVQKLLNVSTGAFTPPPQVESAVVRLTPYVTHPHLAKDYVKFAKLVEAGFSMRRKTLRNCLQAIVPKSAWDNLPVNPGLRAEQLSIGDWVALSNSID